MSPLFLFASIGVVNGFLVSVYLLFKKGKPTSDVYFAGLLACLSVRIGKSIIYYFDRQTDLLILQVGLSFCVFIGPFFYLYLRSRFRNDSHVLRSDKLLLLILAVGIVVVGLIYPYRQHPDIWNGILIYWIYGIWIFFTLLGLSILFFDRQSLTDLTGHDRRYLISIVLAYLFITITYQSALFFGIFYIWGSLIFTISFYYLMFRVVTRKESVLPHTPQHPLENADQLMRKLKMLMKDTKPYLDPGLRLEDLASLMELSRHQLSRLLNEVYPHGFSQFIKEHRVQESKELIISHPEWSLDGVGHEAGFSSRSSFFEAFKKVESMTPAVYRKSLHQEKSPE